MLRHRLGAENAGVDAQAPPRVGVQRLPYRSRCGFLLRGRFRQARVSLDPGPGDAFDPRGGVLVPAGRLTPRGCQPQRGVVGEGMGGVVFGGGAALAEPADRAQAVAGGTKPSTRGSTSPTTSNYARDWPSRSPPSSAKPTSTATKERGRNTNTTRLRMSRVPVRHFGWCKAGRNCWCRTRPRTPRNRGSHRGKRRGRGSSRPRSRRSSRAAGSRSEPRRWRWCTCPA